MLGFNNWLDRKDFPLFLRPITAGIFFFIFAAFVMKCSKEERYQHNCRFWGITFSKNTPQIEETIRRQLDSLRALSLNNPDGWGIGYFFAIDSFSFLPVIRRGEPEAAFDPRYQESVDEIIKYGNRTALVHIRRGTSGPVSGIPNPHPFRRRCINRRFDMLFAHNGTIPVDVLSGLINQINPFYLKYNPPDYSPNFLDSDLFGILLVEVIDTYLQMTIEECIRLAIVKLDSALGPRSGEMNFVMTDGKTLWALNFTRSIPGSITAYFYPATEISDFWIAASQPLDTFSSLWIEIPNKTLVCLKPDTQPILIPIYSKQKPDQPFIMSANSNHPNPFSKMTEINYSLAEYSTVEIIIYDQNGRRTKNLLRAIQLPGEYTVLW
ncbi:MAG: class II glutamine amidotransferase, partial [candidate division WOR-3 bacterium]